MEQVIHLQNVRFSWLKKSTPLIDIPDFRIDPGERLFLQGPSGSGKTTLLGIIGGILVTQRGQVNVAGSDLAEMSSKEKDRFRVDNMGYIFQMFNLLPYLSIIDNVCLPCRFSKDRLKKALEKGGNVKDEAIRLLTALGLEDLIKQSIKTSELSVGQQQRVAVARALIGRPKILIADEPTSSLDADNREAFLDLLFQECDSAKSTLIFVSHDSGLASFFDRSVKLSDINRTIDNGLIERRST